MPTVGLTPRLLEVLQLLFIILKVNVTCRGVELFVWSGQASECSTKQGEGGSRMGLAGLSSLALPAHE